MSQRNSSGCARVLLGIALFFIAGGCSTKGVDGSTHFVQCHSDAECSPGQVCSSDQHCVTGTPPQRSDAASGGAGAGAVDAAPGGTSLHAAATRETRDASKRRAADAATQGITPSGATCTPDDDNSSLVSPYGYAKLHGCHQTRKVVDPSCLPASSEIRACDVGRVSSYFASASDLPCGACLAGDSCYLAVMPSCDCDGDGPDAPFTEFSTNNDLVDGWVCQCEAGTWQCYLRDQSGTSCFPVCAVARKSMGLGDAGLVSGAASSDGALSCSELLDSVVAIKDGAGQNVGVACASVDDCVFGPGTTCDIGCGVPLISRAALPVYQGAMERADVLCGQVTARDCPDPHSGLPCAPGNTVPGCVDRKCTMVTPNR